jgi:hypothetical protein
LDYLGFVKSVVRDVRTELTKWFKSKKNQQGIAVFMGFIVVMGVMFSYQAGSIKVGAAAAAASSGGGGKAVKYGAGWEAMTGSGQASGNVAENSNAGEMKQEITELNLVGMTFTLKWTDEPDHDRLHENTPDELGIEVVSPGGENKSLSGKNPMGGEGVVTVNFTVEQKKFNGDVGTGDWNYTVFAKDCGNNTPKRVGLLQWLDNGNAYTLEIGWTYYMKTKS